VIKAEFSASLLQSSVSHDRSQITLWWFAAQETFLIINVEHSCAAAACFCGNCDALFSFIVIHCDTFMNRKFKRTAVIWNRNSL